MSGQGQTVRDMTSLQVSEDYVRDVIDLWVMSREPDVSMRLTDALYLWSPPLVVVVCCR